MRSAHPIAPGPLRTAPAAAGPRGSSLIPLAIAHTGPSSPPSTPRVLPSSLTRADVELRGTGGRPELPFRALERTPSPLPALPAPVPATPPTVPEATVAPFSSVHDEMAALQAHIAAQEGQTRRELSEALEAKSESEVRAKALEQELDRARALQLQTAEALELSQVSLKESEAKSGTLARSLTEATQERDALRAEQQATSQKLADQEDDVATSFRDLTEARGLLVREREAIAKLREALDEARREGAVRQRELQTRSDELSRAKHDMARAIERLAHEDASRKTLQGELEHAQARTATLERELEAARAAPKGPSSSPNPKGTVVPLAAVPVIFLTPDGRRVAKQTLLSPGKGGALEGFLGTLLSLWRATGRPLVHPGAASEGLSLELQGDPEQRSIRMLNTGVLVVRMSAKELAQIGAVAPSGAPPTSPPTASRSTPSPAREAHADDRIPLAAE